MSNLEIEVVGREGEIIAKPSEAPKTNILFLLVYVLASIGMNVFMKVCFSKLPIGTKVDKVPAGVLVANGLPTPFFWTMTQQCVSFVFVVGLLLSYRVTVGRYGYEPKTKPEGAWKSVLLLSGIFAANIGLNNLSLELLSLTVNSVIRATSSVWTALAGRLLFKHDKSALEWVCLVLGTLCCVAAVMLDKRSDSGSKQWFWGVVTCFSSTLCGALMFVVVEFFGKSVKLNALDQTCYMSLPVALLLLPAVFCFPHEVSHGWAGGAAAGTKHDAELLGMVDLGPQVWGMVFLSGLFAFLYNCLQFLAIQRLSPVTTACASNGSKALTVMFSMIFFESHTWYSAIAMFVAVVGVVVAFTCYTLLESSRRSDAAAGRPLTPQLGDGNSRMPLVVILATLSGIIFGISILAPAQGSVSPGWTPKPVFSTYPSLGVGNCLDQTGGRPLQGPDPGLWDKASVSATDGRSLDCQDRCTKNAACKGIVTNEAQSCLLLTEVDFLPSDSDGTKGLQCFWRHPWIADSAVDTSLRPVPPLIWSYWATGPVSQSLFAQTLGGKEQETPARFLSDSKEGGHISGSVPPFVRLAVKSWAVLNPNHTVRLLNQDTLKDFVSPQDLPASFARMDATHQADAVRLAVLARHGGIWIDASGLMLQPLTKVMGPETAIQPFFTLDRRSPNSHERRDDGSTYVESSFLTAMPGDLLIGRVKECFNEAFRELGAGGFPRLLESTGIFSKRQLDTMRALAINEYLTIIGCTFKALDEDAGLRRFWESGRVRNMGAFKGIFPQLAAGPDWARMFLEGGPGADAFAQDMIDNSFLMKLRSEDRRPMDGFTEEQLRCKPGAIKKVLEHIGLRGEQCP